MRLSTAVFAGLLGVSTALSQTSKPWPLVDAKSVGMDPAALANFDADIVAGKYGNVDSLLILRHGKVVLDKTYTHDYATIYSKESTEQGPLNAHDPGGPYNYFNPWWHPFYRNGGDLHSMQSVTKTVNSAVIGVAVTRYEFPSLDTPVLSFFDPSKVANVDERKRKMTIRNLLTMTTGVAWNDDVPYNDPRNSASQMEASEDWVKFFIDQPMADEPGTKFYYNDGAPVVLAYIFRKATGQDEEEYAAKYLFAPLGIDHWFWKRIPMGLADTEGGLYLERHDLAKFVMLFQKGGVWDGTRIESEEWVRDSIAPAITTSQRTGTKYGYAWWLTPYSKDDPRLAFGGSGFGGQWPIVIPDYDIVIVATAWNLGKGPSLNSRTLIDRVLAAVTDGKH